MACRGRSLFVSTIHPQSISHDLNFTLLTIILNLIGINGAAPINCQVGGMSGSRVYVGSLAIHDSKDWVTLNFVCVPAVPVCFSLR